MYGLVNRAVERLVRTEFGDDAWQAIRTEAGVPDREFQAMQQYDDGVTYSLVGAASKRLGLPAEDILVAFGRYWVRYSADEGYGPLMAMGGDSMFAFLQKLDEMHARVAVTFPKLRPPSFECTNVTEDGLDLHYYSDREGLAPFVRGLLEGLSERFAQPVTIEQIAARAHGEDHDVFRVRSA